MLLTTGNKSEVAVGYCTLYGDMAGGLAVISDVPKMMVYELARFLNSEWEKRGKPGPIPEGTLTKPPSAELKPGQRDQDSLPPYDVLDAIIEMYVEDEKSPAEIIAAGHDADVVKRIVRLIDLAEYKRRQAAPGLKVTSRAFGFGRRMPIAQGFDMRMESLRLTT
jgi:NAD+ synthase (glutamine-hydrolysing)